MNFLLPEEESRLSQPADAAAADQPAPTTFLLPNEQPVEQRATTTLRNVMPINPDKAGEARRIANNTGMAEPVVDRNFEQAKNESRLRDLQSVLASSPILARQLTDPNFAKLAHDDVEQLSLIERMTKTYLGASAKSGIESLIGTGAKLLDTLNPFTLSEQDAAVLFKDDPAKLAEMKNESPAMLLSRFTRSMQQASEMTMDHISQAAKNDYGSLKYATTDPSEAAYLSPVKIVGDAVQSLPTTLALMVSMYVTKGVGTTVEAEAIAAGIAPEIARKMAIKSAAETMAKLSASTEGAAGYGQQAMSTREQTDKVPQATLVEQPQYKQLIAEGFSPDAARAYLSATAADQAGAAGGVVDAVTNFFGGKLLGRFITEGGKLVPRMAKGGLTEALTEAAQGGLEQVGQNQAMQQFLDQNKSLFDGVAENIAQGFFVGGLTGGAFSGVLGGNKQAKDAEKHAEAITELAKLSEASKARERDKSGFAEFMQSAADESGTTPTEVRIDATVLEHAFAQAGLTIEEASQAMPSVGEQFAEAKSMNGEIIIPIGEFMANLPGTGLEQALIPHIRTSAEGMTQDEAKTFMQSHAEEFQKHAEQILGQQEFDTAHKESGDVVEHELLTQLNATKRFSPEANAVKAKLAAAFFRVYSARLGMTPEEMYVKYALDVNAVGGVSSMDQQARETSQVVDDLRAKYPDLKLDAMESRGKINLSRIALPKDQQGQGTGTEIMRELIAHADDTGKTITLSPSGDFGGSVERLKKFYKSLGFIENKGKNKDFEIGESMYRLPARRMNQSASDYFRSLGIESGATAKQVNQYQNEVEWKNYGTDEKTGFPVWSSDKVALHNPRDVTESHDVFYKPPGNERAVKYDIHDTTGKKVGYTVVELDGDMPTRLLDIQIDKSEQGKQHAENTVAALAADAGELGIWHIIDSARSWWDRIGTRTVDEYDGAINFRDYADARAGREDARSLGDPLKQENRGQISFAGDITKAPSVISLLQNADLSTFVHELGHFQLEVLAHISSQPDAPAEIRADMDAVLKWFAVPGTDGTERLMNWNMLSLDEKRPMHEQLARGFEAYLFEGNAPSVELQGVFSRIRAWMLHVYQSLSKLNVTLNDDVRGVFDRLLATNDEILAAEAARGYSPLFNSAEEMGATQAEWKAYQEQNQGQTQEAVDQLGSRSLRDMRWVTNTRAKVMKALQRDANSKRKAVKAEVAAEVRQQPVYSAQHFLKTGEMIGPEGDLIKVDKGAKLDNAALAEMYPEGMLAPPDLTNLQGMTRTDGLHPDLVAQMFGFTSGDQMVRDFVAAEPEAAHVEAVTDQRMLERYGDLSSPEAISRATDEAIHNEVRGKFLLTEANALSKAIGKTKILGKAAKAFAAQIIARKKIRDVKPAQYSAAEARAGKAAEKAKSLVEKATEKRNQLVNHHAARAAYEALAEVDKGLARFKRLDGNQSVDIAYRDQIDQLLERFDLRSGQTLKAIDKRTNLAEWITSQESLGFEPTISDELRNEAFRKSYKDMTVEEFRGLVDAVKNIEHLGRLKKKLLTAKDNREFHTAVEDIATTIKENAKKTLPEQRASDRGFLVKMGSLFRTAVAMHRKFASLVRGFDGYKDGGVAWENLVRNMNERGNFEAVENEKATMALTKLLSPVMKAGKLTQKQFFPDSGKSFTREERIGIALNMGNEVNRERVMSGEKLAPDQLESILNTLTKEDWNFVQGVWDYFDTFRPQIAAKERRITGTEPEWVEASPVHTIHGEYKGGYYPIAYDPLRSERSNADMNAEVARQVKQGLYARAQTSRGHTKARSDSTGRPLRYDFGEVITRHVTQVVHDLAWHEYLVDANRLLASTEIENAVRDHYGVEVIQQLKNTLKDIAIGTMRAEEGAAFFNHLRFGTTIVGLAYNVFNTLQNLTGITQSMSRIGTKWVMKGAAHWAGDAVRFEGSVKQIHDMSDFMRLRAKTMQREINDIRNKVSGNDSKLQASYFYLQQKTQVMVDVPTWWGAYEKAMAEDDMTQDKAIALADQSVLDAQGSGQIKDQAGIMRGGAGLKLLTTFYSFFNTTFNLTAEAAGRTNFKKPGQVALFAADMVLLYTLPALLTTLLKAALMGDWDDEDKMAKKIAGDQISFALGTVIGLREASAGAQAAVGVGEGFGYTGPASLRFFSDLYNLGKQVHQGEADEPFWKSLNNVGGVLFHYPAGQLNRTAAGLNALLDGRTQNPLALVMGAPPKK